MGNSNTKYTVRIDGVEGETRSRKDSAIALAETAFNSAEGGVSVDVVTSAGTVVFAMAAATPSTPAPAKNRAKPYTRTEEAPFEAPQLEGYTAAYVRRRIRTVVYRANDKSGLLVVDTRTGDQVPAKDTTEARHVTTDLSRKYLQDVQNAREAAKAEKRQAREAKKAAKEAQVQEHATAA